MINLKKLTEKDIERRVKRIYGEGTENLGSIKTWDDTFVHVIYDGWGDNVSEPVFPQHLTFIKENKERR